VFREDEYISTANIRNETKGPKLLTQWKAPETLKYEVYTIKSDVWSFGVLLWEVLSFGRAPFGTFNAAEITAEIAAGRRLEPPEVCSPVLATAMAKCWEIDPQERLTFAAVEGVLRLLMLPESTVLRAKVEAASEWHPDSQVAMRGRQGTITVGTNHETTRYEIPMQYNDTARFEIPMRRWQRKSEDIAPFGIGCGEMRWREYESTNAADVSVRGHVAMLGLVAEFSKEIVKLRDVLQTLVELSHPQVLEFVGCNSVAGFTVFFECPAHGTLRRVLDRGDTILTTPAQRERIVIDVALGVEFLDANDAAATLITSSTVFVTAELGARVCISGHVLSAGTLGTAVNEGRYHSDELNRWGAPELIGADPKPPSSASAVWSYGVVLWEVFSPVGTGLPYSPLTKTELHTAVANPQGRPKLIAPSGFPDVCKSVFAGCQIRAAETRPTMNFIATLLLEELGGPEWWELPREELEFIERLGSGQFGDVNKMAARLLPHTPAGSSDSFVAVKTLKGAGTDAATGNVDSAAATAKAEAEFMAEIDVMKSLRHPNLVTLLGVCTKERPLLMVLEYLPGGSLNIWLPKCGKHARPFELLWIVNQTACGMVALGTAEIIHRDLAARNVLVDEKLQVKIADFGLSRETDEDDRNYYRMQTNRPLPLRWTAPEVVTKRLYSVRSDVYAFGVFVFEVYSFGAFPFAHIKKDQTFLGLLGGTGGEEVAPSLASNLQSNTMDEAPDVVRTLLEECLRRESKDRPSFADILERTKPVRTTASVSASAGAGAGVASSTTSSANDFAKGSGAALVMKREHAEGSEGGIAPTRLDSEAEPGHLAVGRNEGASETNETQRAVETPKKTGPKRKPSVYLGFDEGGEDDGDGATETTEL
jgi:serine/threonine protein kinase